ncbi:MAG: hypothetical protein J6J57_07160 [Alistipes sp.]|nr:hypothetical protein [Alistipes sp.]
MADKNMFLFSTVAQVNYFAQVGRLIALGNYKEDIIVGLADSQKENVLCIHIPHTYSEMEIQIAISQAWHISETRPIQPNIKCIFAIFENTIVGVYKFAEKNQIVDSSEEGRRKLNIKLAKQEYQIKYLGRKINIEFTQQPIRYIYIEDL